MGAIGLVPFNALMHKPVSDVFDALLSRIGFARYDWWMSVGICGVSLGLAALLGALTPPPKPVRAWLALGPVALLSWLCHDWLLVANIELIHFPQFALFAGLLVLGGFGSLEAWALATVAGVVDEAYQHWVVYLGRAGTYLDTNDMVLNTVGAAWGALLFAGFSATPKDAAPGERALPRPVLIGSVLAVAALVWALTTPPVVPAFRDAATSRIYRLLSFPELLATTVAVGGIVLLGTWDRRRRSWA